LEIALRLPPHSIQAAVASITTLSASAADNVVQNPQGKTHSHHLPENADRHQGSAFRSFTGSDEANT
jgi:Spy/CpxP family protein refolding chaperone